MNIASAHVRWVFQSSCMYKRNIRFLACVHFPTTQVSKQIHRAILQKLFFVKAKALYQSNQSSVRIIM